MELLNSLVLNMIILEKIVINVRYNGKLANFNNCKSTSTVE